MLVRITIFFFHCTNCIHQFITLAPTVVFITSSYCRVAQAEKLGDGDDEEPEDDDDDQ